MSAALQEVETDEGQAAAPSVEDRARAQGWRPKDEFRGPPDKWRDAETYLKVGEEELPVIRERARRQDREIQSLTAKTDEQLGLIKTLLERSQTAERRAYERARADLKAQQERAVEEADKASYRDATEKLEKLEPPPPPPKVEKTQAVAPPPPEVVEWLQENQWFNTDPVLANYARSANDAMVRAGGISLAESLKRTTAAVKAAYPERFPSGDNSRRNAPADVSSSAPGGRVARTGFDALEPEGKRQYERTVAQFTQKGWKIPTKDEWVKTWNGE